MGALLRALCAANFLAAKESTNSIQESIHEREGRHLLADERQRKDREGGIKKEQEARVLCTDLSSSLVESCIRPTHRAREGST